MDQSDQKIDQTLYNDIKFEENIDEYGYFNYSINVDPNSARKLRYIIETIRSGGDNLFIGVKKKLCLLSLEGEVILRTKNELSIDAFLALCILFNV